MAEASELMWPGVPVTAWASMSPPASKTAAERSPASLTAGVRAVRISAAACSSVIAISRFQRTSQGSGELTGASPGQAATRSRDPPQVEMSGLEHDQAPARRDDGRGGVLFDQQRSVDRL